MKTYNKTYLPEKIDLKGRTYVLDLEKTNSKKAGCSFNAKNCVQVNVLENNLKGREDLHGMPYKPRSFIFSTLTNNSHA